MAEATFDLVVSDIEMPCWMGSHWPGGYVRNRGSLRCRCWR